MAFNLFILKKGVKCLKGNLWNYLSDTNHFYTNRKLYIDIDIAYFYNY